MMNESDLLNAQIEKELSVCAYGLYVQLKDGWFFRHFFDNLDQAFVALRYYLNDPMVGDVTIYPVHTFTKRS